MKPNIFYVPGVVKFFVLSLAFETITAAVSPKKLLFMITHSTRSESGFFAPIINELAGRGHDITVVTSDPLLQSDIHYKNVTQIVPFTSDELFDEKEFQYSVPYYVFYNKERILEFCHVVFENQDFKQKVLKKKFDMILINAYFTECFYGLAFKDPASLVLLQTFPLLNHQVQGLGSYSSPSILPFSLGQYSDDMNFPQRVLNFLADWGATLYHEFVNIPAIEAVYRKQLGQHYPGFQEIHRNVSLVLVNTDPATSSMRALTPDVIETGCIHCREPKPLPKDLEDFISGAEEGFIYFSLGITGAKLGKGAETEQKLLRVFSKLKQRVLWKSDPDKSGVIQSNVIFKNFFPQQDVLGHKHIRLYISHGGLFGTFESIYHAVPVLGVPAFFDQFGNIATAVKKGYALQLDLDNVDENVLEDTIKRLIYDTSFKNRVTQISNAMKERQNTPMEVAIFHIERVLQHKEGIVHLQNTNARNLNIFQLHSLDVIALLVVAIGIAILILKIKN